jgi:hypothetical protein
MRIAVCISGQLRTFRHCVPALKKNILNRHNCGVFLHVWEKIGSSPKEGKNSPPATITIDELNALYDPVEAIIEKSGPMDSETLKGIHIPSELIKAEPIHHKGSLPMFYKIYACDLLRQNHEQSNGFEYDAVIKLRPDFIIKEPLPREVLDNLQFLWHSSRMLNPTFQVSDKFAVSSSSNMTYYSSVFPKLPEYWQEPLGLNHDEKEHRVGERLLKYHMQCSEITCKTFKMKCDLLRMDDISPFSRLLRQIGI